MAIHDLGQDNHLRDCMEHSDKDMAGKDKTMELTSKSLRLAFFGMFRKAPNSSLDTFLNLNSIP